MTETLTLFLHKTKGIRNKVVYGIKDDSVIQAVCIDRDALCAVPLNTIKAVISPE